MLLCIPLFPSFLTDLQNHSFHCPLCTSKTFSFISRVFVHIFVPNFHSAFVRLLCSVRGYFEILFKMPKGVVGEVSKGMCWYLLLHCFINIFMYIAFCEHVLVLYTICDILFIVFYVIAHL